MSEMLPDRMEKAISFLIFDEFAPEGDVDDDDDD
jgi:hypothetical protein